MYIPLFLIPSIFLRRYFLSRYLRTDQNRTAETEQARDLVDTFQLEWDASYPGMHFKCVPSVTRLVRMGEYIARAVDETLAEFDLNRGEAEVLFALVRNPHIDITPKIIQTRILVSSGGLTRRLDRLEEKGLISRLPDPNDRRGTVLKPTKDGIVLALRAHKAHTEKEARLVATLSENEKKTLEKLLKKLILSQEDAISPGGLQ